MVRSTWDKVIVDRQGDLSEWVSLLKKVQEQRVMILAFSNNHYAGHGPSTVEMKGWFKGGNVGQAGSRTGESRRKL